MTQIRWTEIPEAGQGEGFAAELLAFSEGGEVRIPYDGGYVHYFDAAHTAESPQSVAADTSTLLSIDNLGAGSVTRFRRDMSADVWADNTLKPNGVGEAYTVRLDMLLAKSASQQAWIEIDLGIGEGFGTIITALRTPLIKGQDVTERLSFAFPIYCLETFGLNGGRFFMVASEDVTVWGKSIFIQRTLKP